MRIDVIPVYTCLREGDLNGAAALVIDTLRMTSVAAAALANGCAGIKAAAGVDEARGIARRTGALLGGERAAMKIPGFDLSNSPYEYTEERVGGRRVVMTTTNGAQAISACAGAEHVFLGCLLNASAAAGALAEYQACVIVPAGTAGRFSLEDAVTAGAVLTRLKGRFDPDDMAICAMTLYERAKNGMRGFMKDVPHVKRLISLGYERDVDRCLEEDMISCVPRLDGDGWFVP